MLKEVIQIIANSPYLSKKEIGNRLNISENLLEQVFIDLIRMGYLKRQVCDSSCHSCPVANFCSKTDVTIDYWLITQKGYQLIQSA